MKTFKLYRSYSTWGKPLYPISEWRGHIICLELITDTDTYMTNPIPILPSGFKRAYYQLKKLLENLCENNEAKTL